RFTLGAYLKGSFGNFNYKSDLAYQTGSTLKDSTKLDVGSYMVTADLGYTFKAKTKPKLVAGAAYLSGDDNSTDDKYGVFNTLFATNHKFYGYMDYFLNIPLNTYDKGLIDIYGKFGLWAAKKLWLNLDYHLFNSAADYTLISGETSNSFGSEIDFTLLYKYTKKLSFVLGLSTFSPGDIFKEKRGEDSSTWGYLMVIANFN
ncbi:MAG: alginate export family protein, partial [Melioribacteraceae bacterium]|nr:alginate export family protein [Melioribacteraceae bacterium]